MLLSRAGFDAENLDDFKGLNQRSPWFAASDDGAVAVSLAGVPPMMGFYAKLAVLQLGAGVPGMSGCRSSPCCSRWSALITICASSSSCISMSLRPTHRPDRC
jgi:formate hydrogenlyase subunit 3/multisubunit Na+/H+ antiporter MnhD subunit